MLREGKDLPLTASYVEGEIREGMSVLLNTQRADLTSHFSIKTYPLRWTSSHVCPLLHL